MVTRKSPERIHRTDKTTQQRMTMFPEVTVITMNDDENMLNDDLTVLWGDYHLLHAHEL